MCAERSGANTVIAMYATPPPWWYMMPPQQPQQDMQPKDFIEFAKAIDEWKNSFKPKEEKKDDKKADKLSVGEMMVIITAIYTGFILLFTSFGLWQLTQFMKAIPH